jgi:hypothetical protein
MNLEDKIAIYEVLAQYSYAYDGKNADGFAELFTEDAVWEARRQVNTAPYIHHESQKTIRDWVTERLQGRLATTFTRHFQTGTLFEELTLNTARSRTMVLITHQTPEDGAPRVVLSGE